MDISVPMQFHERIPISEERLWCHVLGSSTCGAQPITTCHDIEVTPCGLYKSLPANQTSNGSCMRVLFRFHLMLLLLLSSSSSSSLQILSANSILKNALRVVNMTMKMQGQCLASLEKARPDRCCRNQSAEHIPAVGG